MKEFYLNFFQVYLCRIKIVKQFANKLSLVMLLFFSSHLFSQSNHTVAFTNSTSDFNALEKISASAGNTDYYITFDQNYLYISVFNTSGSFATNDNLAIYIDTDPQSVPISGNGSATGLSYNGVTPSLPFKADYNVYAEQLAQEANSYSGGWIASSGPTYSTTSNSREVKIPFASLGNPYALNITMWMGNAGSIYSNAPGVNIASSATPAIANYFGTFGIKNGTQGNANPINVVSSPASGYLAGATSIAGGVYAYIDITANATINGLTLAPGGVINVETGKTLTSTGTINNTAILNNLQSTQINVSGTYTLKAFAYCSSFNVNNGGTYNHNVTGTSPNGATTDWPGINTRTYGASSNVNILQWATSSATLPIGIPAPTSGGWGNVTINVSQTYGGNWNQKGAFNNISGNLTLDNLGTNLTPTPPKSFTFNPQLPGATINIGGNFQFSAGSNNNVFICEPSNPGPTGTATHTMNVHGDFIVKSGHLKFAYHYATVVINSWGSYTQTGGDVQAISNPDITKVIINSYGVNKIFSVTPSFTTSFNTYDIIWYIQNGAIIGLATSLPFGGKSITDPTNIELIVNGTLNCNAQTILNLAGPATFTLSPGGTLGIGSASGIASSGSSGNIQMTNRNFSTAANYVYNGTSNQITGTGLPATVNSLTINNSSNSNTVSLTNNVIITSYHEIDKGIFSIRTKNVTLHSDANATASFNALGAGATITYNTGRYIVERFINTGTGAGQHGKSWQLLSAPANGGTVYNTWQESGLTPTGYGTWITDPSGTANGFDDYSPAPSIKTYNPATNDWDGIGSTNNLIANQIGYFLFVRGDRNARAINSTPTPTTLRTTGKLFTGNHPGVNVPMNSFQSIGNPYPSAVNFRTLYSKSANIDNSFYVWDPSLNGSYGLGGYQTISAATGYLAIPGGTDIYNSTTDYPNIQSGQAFMVYNSVSSPGSVNFTEDCKNTGSSLVNRVAGASTQTQFLFADLFTSSGILADGNAVAFDNSFPDRIDKNDAIKLNNAGENFGIKKDSESFAIEAIPPVTQADTIFYDMHNLKQQNYRLVFIPKNMFLGLNAFLIDQYLKTEKAISLSDSTFINFSITSDTTSSVANRFMIVFRPSAEALAVSFISVNAYKQNTNVNVEWEVENETNMLEYEVERSIDGTHFSMITTKAAMNISKSDYNYIDQNPFAGINYYRISSVQQNGQVEYSNIVKVDMGNLKPSISVYPNPLTSENINLQFIDQPAGNYKVRLFNTSGQLMIMKEINFAGGSSAETLQVNKDAANGIYQLEIIKPNGENEVIKVRK
ncbi:MAG TPA: T9SS type A sorting domain-containing protein [Hanamia sp.]